MVHEPVAASAAFLGKSQWGPYGDAIEELDHHTERLLDTLKHPDLPENTLVIFTSDNGRGPGRNATQPLRGNKLNTWEAGIRVPAIAWGAGVRRGHVTDSLVHAINWFPTLATFAGIKIPEDRVLDGRDLSPLLLGQIDAIPDPAKQASLNAAAPLRRL